MLKSILTYFFIGVILLLGITSVSAESNEAVVKVTSNPELGTILAANNSLTLYTFANDDDSVSNCEGDCAGSWPPYLVNADTALIAEGGIPGTLGTTTRSDGNLQVTYDNKPLYFFITDNEIGEANGEGAGGVWYTVRLDVPNALPQATEEPNDGGGSNDNGNDNNNGDGGANNDTTNDTPPSVPSTDGSTVSKANNPQLGTILVASNGMTLYTFTNDEAGVSNCVGNCAALWPPLLVASATAIPSADGVNGTFGVITRNDGTFQVSFSDSPVYTYTEDTQPGDVNGQGVGNVWFAIALDTVRAGSHPDFGSVLVAANGMTLYTFSNDEAGVSNCVGNCAALWPPLTVASADAGLGAGAGVNGELGTLTRDDGSVHVTLNGRPLYFYSEDAQPGDVNGHGVGDVWFSVALDTVRIANNATLGNILVASNGMTVYTFANDEPGWSNCVGDCANTWSPLAVADAGSLFGAGSLQNSLATSERADGTLQVTVDNHPLYLFANDAQPGDTNGQGAGDVWFVVPLEVVAQVSGNTALGGFLADSNGKTLYTFANDEIGVSNCNGDCAATWPALTLTNAGAFPVSADAFSGALGTITRNDGVTQVTLDGRPLYRFSNDIAPGDANGQGAGEVWYVVAVEADPAQFASASCILTVVDFENVNVRQQPTTDATVTRTIPRNDSVIASGQNTAGDGYVWFQLQAGDWVRSDVMTASAACQSLPQVTP